MPHTRATSCPDPAPGPDEVDDHPASMSRTSFVRGMALATAGLLGLPAATRNVASAYAATRVGRPSALGTLLGNVRTLGRNKALTYTDPASGDPAILIRLNNGHLVSYDAVCTHAGCTVGYEPSNRMLLCPCHNSVFDPGKGAAVVSGPAPSRLPSLPIRVDTKGNVYALDGKTTSGTKGNKLQPSKPPVAGSGDDGGTAGQGKHSRRRPGDDGGD
ncbi:MAG: Rieske 2Fe-2S domain-containing protein [Chloroflexota bacterium]|nr:Rieske 2Fe-2S domain-containing protein [Chloroflexota bacterium]